MERVGAFWTKAVDKAKHANPFHKEDVKLSTTQKITESLDSCCGLGKTQRIALFFLCLGAGALMMFLAVTYIPMIVVGMGVKFALTYTLANVLILSSTCFLVGPMTQLKSMLAPNRFLVTMTLVGTLGLSLHLSLSSSSVVLMAPVLFVQVGSLVWYVASYIPYGSRAMSWMGWGAMKGIKNNVTSGLSLV